jgi:hypothetical protein
MSGTAFAICRLLALLALALGSPARAQDSPADLLFARPHLSMLPAGSELTYRLEREPSDSSRLGQPLADDIKLLVRSVTPDGGRDVDIRMFTGARGREVNGITGLTGNPVLVIFLDRAVSDMVRLTGGTAPYFKDRLRAGLREKAKSEPFQARFEGKTLDAMRIRVQPFVDETNVARMLGYEGAEFEFLIAEQVPGMLLEMHARYASPLPQAPRLDERIVLKSWSERP